MTHVYVIQAEGGPVKVGIAAFAKRRLYTLRTGSHSRLSLCFDRGVPDGRAAEVEAVAHEILREKRRAGEWFDVPVDVAVSAVLEAAERLGLRLLEPPPARAPVLPPASIPQSGSHPTSEQIRAARALIRWEQKHLAEASKVSIPSIKRLEAQPGPLAAQARTVDALRAALEAAGVEFTNGGQPGVRMTRRSDG